MTHDEWVKRQRKANRIGNQSAVKLKAIRMDKMRGRCGDKTAREWAAELRCSVCSIQTYARQLEEACKRPDGSRPKSDVFDHSLMQTWARRRIA